MELIAHAVNLGLWVSFSDQPGHEIITVSDSVVGLGKSVAPP
jgi:hypothetical protein